MGCVPVELEPESQEVCNHTMHCASCGVVGNASHPEHSSLQPVVPVLSVSCDLKWEGRG